jgi:hypothetical protein
MHRPPKNIVKTRACTNVQALFLLARQEYGKSTENRYFVEAPEGSTATVIDKLPVWKDGLAKRTSFL